MELQTKSYLRLAVSAYVYHWVTKNSLRPIHHPERTFISPAFEGAIDPLFKFAIAMSAFESLRSLGVSDTSSAGFVALGIFATEWYVRTYESTLVKLPSGEVHSARGELAAGWPTWEQETSEPLHAGWEA